MNSKFTGIFRFLAIALLTAACSSTGDGDSGPMTVHIEPLVSLAGMGDRVGLKNTPPALSSTGYIVAKIVTPLGEGVGAFNPDGQLIQTIAQRGDGPGELRSVGLTGFGPGDTIWIVDQDALAKAYSPPPNSQYVRSMSLRRGGAQVTPYGILSNFSVMSRREESRMAMFVYPPLLTNWDGEEVANLGEKYELPRDESGVGEKPYLVRG